jgi:AAA-like domain
VRAPRLRRRRPSSDAVLPLVDSVEVFPRHLGVGSGVRRTVAVVGYPHEVRLGWLEPVVTHAGPVDVSVHVEPVPARLAADRLRRQLARFESSRRLDASRGRLADPELEAAAEDARELAHRLARGEGRLFRLGLYATVRGPDDDAARVEVERLRSVLDSLLLDAVPATFRPLEGWLTTLPLGLDLLGMRRTVDTAALAAGFPFASAEPSEAGGVLWGLNARSGGLVCWDRFAQPNHNAVVLARSGAGKSYLTKLELLRSLYRGVEAVVVDPEDEYGRLADAVGGTTIRLGASGVRLNPLDLAEEPDALDRRVMFAHTLVAVLLGASLDASERACLDRAVVSAYAAKGITGDPRSHGRPAPVLADLVGELADGGDAGRGLAERLAPYVSGSHRHLFNGPTTTRADGHLVVFSLRELPDEMKGAGVLLTLDAVWRRVADPARRARRLVVVDEGWWLMRQEAGARFLYRLAKGARKHWCGLTVTTQDAADVLGSDLGLAVVSNAATQVLLRQAPQAMPALAEAFRLSEGEQRFLLAARTGEGLLLGGTDRVAFRSLASPAEHPLVTTDPSELFDNPDDEAAAA